MWHARAITLWKEILARIVSMLVGLIRSTSADRIHEERAEYETDDRRLAD